MRFHTAKLDHYYSVPSTGLEPEFSSPITITGLGNQLGYEGKKPSKQIIYEKGSNLTKRGR